MDNLESASLISLGQLADNNCTVILMKDKLIGAKQQDVQLNIRPEKVILEG